MSDNVDPFHLDEPYHNEELYRQIKDQLVKNWTLVRRQFLREAIDGALIKLNSDGNPHTEKEAREKLVSDYATDLIKNYEQECKNDSDKDCKEKKAKAHLDNYEALYQAIKTRKNLATDRSLKPSPGADRLIFPQGYDEVKARQDALEEVERIYEKPRPDGEYALQESTKAYILHFLKPSSKSFDIRYRQKTSSSFDFDSFSKKADDSVYKIVHYTPNVGGNKALVDISFFVEKEKPPPDIDVVNKNISRVAEAQIEEKKGTLRVSFYVDYEKHGKQRLEERDHFWVKLTSKETGTAQPKVNNLDIELPLRPVITEITINKPPVPDDSGSQITIKGINLQNVQKVVVAGQDADIAGTPSKDALLVTLKKGVFINEEKGIKIPVSLTTKDGATVTAVVTIQSPEASGERRRTGRADKSGRAKPEYTKKDD